MNFMRNAVTATVASDRVLSMSYCRSAPSLRRDITEPCPLHLPKTQAS